MGLAQEEGAQVPDGDSWAQRRGSVFPSPRGSWVDPPRGLQSFAKELRHPSLHRPLHARAVSDPWKAASVLQLWPAVFRGRRGDSVPLSPISQGSGTRRAGPPQAAVPVRGAVLAVRFHAGGSSWSRLHRPLPALIPMLKSPTCCLSSPGHISLLSTPRAGGWGCGPRTALPGRLPLRPRPRLPGA